MAWNGSGLFVRLYNWVTDAGAGIDIEATRMDGEDDNFAAGINNCLTKDGQNSPTANLPMNSKKHTNVANAMALDEYAAFGQVRNGTATFYGTTSGDSDDFTVNPTPSISAYTEGMRFTVRLHADANAGATLNINSKGTRQLQHKPGDNIDAGMLLADDVVEFYYNGSGFVMCGIGRSFLSLNDVPDTFASQAGKALVVNDDEDALVFADSAFTGCILRQDPAIDDRTMTAGANNAVEFTNEDADSDDFHDPSTNNTRITIPTGKGGIYRLTAAVQGTYNQSAKDRKLWFRKNGSTQVSCKDVHWEDVDAPGSPYPISMHLTALVNLSAGDYVELILEVESTGDLEILNNAYGAVFSAELRGVSS